MARYLAAILAGIVVLGCAGQSANSNNVASSRDDFLSDDARAQLHLPAKGELTLAKKDDTARIEALPPEVADAVGEYLDSQSVEWCIVAARPVGKYWLLWISFPKIMDGGVDLIYSQERNKIVGEFLGGWRG
jgi:hypothetical protein